ncbi:ferrous iron transport protein A [Clostridium aceticum]|uniref:Ferrous iron transport protein A n=1 Tax=Clostridium aceticum TaxID=84022 RepID=A0A0D8IDL0_9CLOT|nr:FeoA family protein [Clostridium aceticum]AKL94388.1 ferrous iron transport protein A [Clostridium aceticum]KJF28385.1 iron transporter FeoA [Clostridium aceticum]
MKEKLIPLNLLPIGGFARVKELVSEGSARRRMLDLGLITDTKVESLRKSPSGDPIAYEIRGTVIALRSEEASKILVEAIEK